MNQNSFNQNYLLNMNKPSAFQTQYPLSQKKFWKKIIPSFIFWFIISVGLAIFQIIFVTQLFGASDLIDMANFINISLLVFYSVVVVSFVIYIFYIKAYIKRYYYDCGDQFVTIKKGVFAPTEIHVQYQKIQDVYVDQDLWDRIMGLYDVHIASATVTSGIEAHIDGVNVDVAENLKNIILEKIHGGNNPPSIQASSGQPQSQQSSSVQFAQKISSDTYPIDGAWVVSMLGSSLFSGIIWSLIIIGCSLGNVDYHSTSIFLILFLSLLLIIFFFRLVYLLIWKKNYYFEFMPEYILLRTGVISKSENHLPYKSIQNVLNKQSILNRILGLSTVIIQNAAQQMVSSRGQAIGQGSAISLVWQPKDKAEELSNMLNEIVTKANAQNSNSMGL